MSKLFRVDMQDLWKGLVVAVIAAVLTALSQAMNVPGFEFSTFDWGQVIKMALMTGLSYLGKNLLTTEQGDVLGVKVGK